MSAQNTPESVFPEWRPGSLVLLLRCILLILPALLLMPLPMPCHALSAVQAEESRTSNSPAETQEILIFSRPDQAGQPGQSDQPETAEEMSENLAKTIDVSGFVELKAAQDIRQSEGFEHARMLRNRIRLEGKWTPEWSPQWAQGSTTPEALGTPNLFFLASVQSDYLWFGPDKSTDDYDLELFEGFLHWSLAPWELRLGRQRVRWGKADGVSPVDNLNPQDLREFLLPEVEERKIPNWMARVRFFGERLTLEGVYIPFFEPSRVDYFDTDWSIFGHFAEAVGESSLPPELQAHFAHVSVHEHKPARRMDNGDWGVRAATTLSGWDVAASYLYAWEKLPYIFNSPIQQLAIDTVQPSTSPFSATPPNPALDVGYRRSHILGLEVETTLNGFGLRGEGAYFDRQAFLTNSLVSMDKPVFHYVLGVDYLGEQDWYANLQFGHHAIAGYDPDIMYWSRNDYSFNGEFSKEFWRGNVEAVLRYYYNIQDTSLMLNPHMILRYFRNWELTLGLDIFEGSADTFLGQYRNNDQIYCIIKYHF